MSDKRCLQCRGEVLGTRPRKKFCSSKCCTLYNKNYRKKYPLVHDPNRPKRAYHRVIR